MLKIRDSLFGSVFGVAVGDALGVPFEFLERERLKKRPVTDMEGYGTHNQPPGTWSDDTSLTLCLIDSLCNGYNLKDIADKFVDWYLHGLWTPYGKIFDIGMTTLESIKLLMDGISPRNSGRKDEWSNGNGSLMRISPLIFYTHNMQIEERFSMVHEISGITHAHPRTLIACDFYVQYGVELLKGSDKIRAYSNTVEIINEQYTHGSFGRELKHYGRILQGNIWELEEEEIQSSGYVVHTLEASLWSFIKSNSFQDAVLNAVNLGNDTDTIGAVTGGLAGLYYGFSAIPQEWIEKLAKKEEIMELVENFYRVLVFS